MDMRHPPATPGRSATVRQCDSGRALEAASGARRGDGPIAQSVFLRKVCQSTSVYLRISRNKTNLPTPLRLVPHTSTHHPCTSDSSRSYCRTSGGPSPLRAPLAAAKARPMSGPRARLLTRRWTEVDVEVPLDSTCRGELPLRSMAIPCPICCRHFIPTGTGRPYTARGVSPQSQAPPSTQRIQSSSRHYIP